VKKNQSGQSDDRNREQIGEYVTIFRRGRVWQAIFQLNKKQHRQSLKTSSKKEARLRAMRLEAEIAAGLFKQQQKASTLLEVIEAYREYLAAERRSKATKDKFERVVRLVRLLADTRKVKSIERVDLAFVDAYRAMRVAAPVGPRTIQNEVIIIRQLVNFALTRKMVPQDPLAGMRIKKVKSAPQPNWTREEVDRIINAAGPPHRPSLVLLAETGMRVGELKYLTWDDVDLKHGVIHVRPKDDWTPKTVLHRKIDLSPAARETLLALPRRARWVVTAAPSKSYPKGDNQISERRLLQYLKRVLKKLGLEGKLHTFRHSFISHALTRGIPEAIVREWVGHVDPEVTRIYTHVASEISRAAMAQLSESRDPSNPSKE